VWRGTPERGAAVFRDHGATREFTLVIEGAAEAPRPPGQKHRFAPCWPNARRRALGRKKLSKKWPNWPAGPSEMCTNSGSSWGLITGQTSEVSNEQLGSLGSQPDLGHGKVAVRTETSEVLRCGGASMPRRDVQFSVGEYYTSTIGEVIDRGSSLSGKTTYSFCGGYASTSSPLTLAL